MKGLLYCDNTEEENVLIVTDIVLFFCMPLYEGSLL